MKLLTISSLFPNPVMPNRGSFVKERLCQTLDRRPVQADVIAPLPYFPPSNPRFGEYAAFAQVPPTSELRDDVSVQHPKYFMLPRIGAAFSPLTCARAVERCAGDKLAQADIIDAHFLFPDGVAATLLANRFNKPVVLTARGSDVNFMPHEYWSGKWLRWTFEQNPLLVAVSQSLGRRLRELAPTCRLNVVTNGVDLQRFAPPAPRAELKAKLGIAGPLVVSVGNLVPLKGHNLVIDALAGLNGVNGRVIGQGSEHARLNEQIQTLGIRERVQLTGALGQSELIDYYAAADVLVLASSHEGMPNVLLECLACGTPVIGTAEGAAEIIEKCSFSANVERTPGAIRTAVESLLRVAPCPHEVRQAMANESWETKCDTLYSMYEEMVH